MMNKSGIGWCDFSWNPITGCKNQCVFCYGQNQARRLCGTIRINLSSPQIQKGPKEGLYLLPAPFHNDAGKVIAYPVGFSPTLHSYRLPMVSEKKKPANIYVCSMGELFGEWIPTEWIDAVFDACRAAPWHNYMFLTKAPARYTELAKVNRLMKQDNCWYGSYLIEGAAAFHLEGYHTFVYIDLTDPLLTDIHLPDVEWIIIGCDTPLRKESQLPDRTVIENIIQSKGPRPLFMKSSMYLQEIWGAPLIQEFPSLLQHKPDKPIPHCNRCKQCRIISEGKRGNRHICQHRKILKTCREENGRHVPGRYARTSPEWCPKR